MAKRLLLHVEHHGIMLYSDQHTVVWSKLNYADRFRYAYTFEAQPQIDLWWRNQFPEMQVPEHRTIEIEPDLGYLASVGAVVKLDKELMWNCDYDGRMC